MMALASVVRAHDERDILDRDYDEQGPKHERKDPEHVVVIQRDWMNARERLFQCIQRAGADVAIDDPDRAHGETDNALLALMGRALLAVVRS